MESTEHCGGCGLGCDCDESVEGAPFATCDLRRTRPCRLTVSRTGRDLDACFNICTELGPHWACEDARRASGVPWDCFRPLRGESDTLWCDCAAYGRRAP